MDNPPLVEYEQVKIKTNIKTNINVAETLLGSSSIKVIDRMKFGDPDVAIVRHRIRTILETYGFDLGPVFIEVRDPKINNHIAQDAINSSGRHRTGAGTWHQDGGLINSCPYVVIWSNINPTEIAELENIESIFPLEGGEVVLFNNSKCVHRMNLDRSQDNRWFARATFHSL